jgi:uncharacterized phage protein (TIGR02218 family)
MTFATYEQSNDAGRPIGLYLFAWGNTTWAYTSADRQVVVDAVTYEPLGISDDGLAQGGSGRKEFTIHAPASIPLAAKFRGTPPSESVIVVVRKKHLDDAEAPIHWIGKVTNIRRSDNGAKAEIICRNPGLRRAGLRITWCRQCPYFVFDLSCGLDKALFATTREIIAIDGNNLTLDGAALAASPYYNGGFIEWDADGLGTLERRGIELTLGVNEYQLFGRSDGLTVGQEVTIYPGCDGLSETCDVKFDHLDDHGGLDFMPGRSPYDGNQVF